MASLRHASQLVTLIVLALACATASAALIVNVEGVRGSGKTTWTLSGSAQVTAGSQTQTITHIFLDPDQGKSGDDSGIRVNSLLRYRSKASSSWSGRFTLDLDISNFKLGSYRTSGADFSGTNVTLHFKETATSVPEPPSLALPGLALTGVFAKAKRHSAQGSNSAD